MGRVVVLVDDAQIGTAPRTQKTPRSAPRPARSGRPALFFSNTRSKGIPRGFAPPRKLRFPPDEKELRKGVHVRRYTENEKGPPGLFIDSSGAEPVYELGAESRKEADDPGDDARELGRHAAEVHGAAERR